MFEIKNIYESIKILINKTTVFMTFASLMVFVFLYPIWFQIDDMILTEGVNLEFLDYLGLNKSFGNNLKYPYWIFNQVFSWFDNQNIEVVQFASVIFYQL